MDSVRLASLLCSRVCHDLISPVGAMNNGLEILAEESDPAMIEQVLDLLRHSAGQSSSRLQFYRLAFGAGGGLGASIELSDAEQATRQFFESDKVKVEWSSPAISLPRDVLKVFLGLVLAGGESVVRNGTLKVEVNFDGGALDADIQATGERIIVQDLVISGLKGEIAEDDLDPRSISSWMVHALCERLGAKLDIKLEPGTQFHTHFSCKI